MIWFDWGKPKKNYLLLLVFFAIACVGLPLE